MAKRKRLTPANPLFLDGSSSQDASPKSRPPIADVARDASLSAAAEEMARTLTEAREQGRMIVSIDLQEVEADYLIRDRVAVDNEEMEALKSSIRARGQQTPVELVALENGRFGLISGWRRYNALRQLQAETQEPRFASILGILRRPLEQAHAYVAMVEENEIRVGLSYFERARIVSRSVAQGVFASEKEALFELFQSASRAKRSKIRSFLPVIDALEHVLHYPEKITERQGLQLSKAISENPSFAEDLATRLKSLERASAEEETTAIDAALRVLEGTNTAEPPSISSPTEVSRKPSVNKAKMEPVVPDSQEEVAVIEEQPGRLVLQGPGVTAAFKTQLLNWLSTQK